MASEIVGMGNLPNVYISKITLSDNNTESFNLEVNLELSDIKQGKHFLWSDEKVFYDFLRIGVLVTSNTNLNDQLKNGQISPLPHDLTNFKFDNNIKQYDQTILSLRELKLDKSNTTKQFSAKVRKTVPHSTKNYFVYVYAFIDTVAAANSLKIDLTGILKNYCGPVKSETVMINGTLQGTTTLFLKPDNVPWAGPVHEYEGTYMAGAMHTSTPHSVLKKATVQNLKLVDKRSFHFKNRLQIRNSITPYLSELHCSFNNNTNLSGLFVVNVKQLMLSRVKNARKILGLSPELFDQMMNSVIINSMTIVRQQVKTTRGSNKVGTLKFGTAKVNSYKNVAITREQSSNQLINTNNLQQVYLNKNPYIRYYQFVDRSMTKQSKGQYKYKLFFTIRDTTQRFIDSKIAELKSGYDSLKAATLRMNRLVATKPREILLASPPDDNIMLSIRTYYTCLSYLKSLSKAQVDAMINKTLLSFLISNYNPKNGDAFLTKYNNLLIEFQNKFPSSGRGVSLKRPRSIRKFRQPGIIKIEKQWEEVISFNELRRSYNYLGIKDNEGLAAISLTDLNKRADVEVNRLFDTNKSMVNLDIAELPPVVLEGIKNTRHSKLNFLAPLGFNLDDESIDVSDPSRVNNEKLTNNFLKMQEVSKIIKRPSRSILKKKSNRRKTANKVLSKRKRKKIMKTGKFRFRVSLKKVPLRLVEAINKNKMIKSVEYLGENSEFVNTSKKDLNKIPVLEPNKAIIKDLVLSSTNIQSDRNKENFEVDSPNNFLGQVTESKKFSKSTLKKAPNHFKALVASKSEGVRNNILEDDSDVLKDPSTKVLSEMTYRTTQRIEMLSGFETDSNGNSVVSRPKWIDLDTSLFDEGERIICRMRYTEIPEMGLVPSQDFRIPVLNSIFIISEESLTEKTSDTSIATTDPTDFKFDSKNELSKSIMYARSNVVKQRMAGVSDSNNNSAASSTASTTMTTIDTSYSGGGGTTNSGGAY
jgi:hypothetical protein